MEAEAMRGSRAEFKARQGSGRFFEKKLRKKLL
jgi:hypothetical protein